MKSLKRVRWAVRCTLWLGLAASVVGNILHAKPNPVSQAIAAWPVVALYLTIELISRVPIHRRWLTATRLLAAGLIAGIAAWISYHHMAGVAARYGETGASPYLLPLSVDGLIVVASICLVELGGRIRTAENINEGGTHGNRLGQGGPEGERGDHRGGGQGEVPLREADPQPAEEGGPSARREGERPPSEVPAREVAPAQFEPAKPPARRPHTANPQRVERAHRKTPDATNRELADRLNLSLATIKKYRPQRIEPAAVNGKVPDMEGVQ